MFDYEISELEQSHSEVVVAPESVFTKSLSGSSVHYIIEINTEDEVIKKYKILDEEFYIYSDGENIILTHPQWSLSGIGETLIAAERSLFDEARSILPHYLIPNLELSPDAIKLKEFLQRLV